MAVSHVLSSPIADFTGTVTVFDSAGSTQTANATEIVRPSDWNSAHNQFLTLAGNTAGQSTLSGTNIVWAGGPNVTLSANAGTVSVSVGAGGAGDGVNLIAAGTQTAASTGTVVFSNSNGITFGMSNSSIVTASHNGLTTAAASNHSHGNPQLNLTNLSGTTASNSAGFTLSLSAGNYLTTAMASNAVTLSNIRVSAGTTSNLLSALTFSNSNGVSFGLNGSVITGTVQTNYLTTGAASDHSHGNPTLNLTNLSGTTASNSAGFTLSLSAAAGGGGADGGNTIIAGTRTAGSNSAVLFDNANGITFGLNAAGGSILTASHNALTTARASNDAVGLNTALTAGPLAWTVNSSGLSLNAGSAAGTTSGFGGNLISGSMTHNTAGLNLSLNHPAWLTTAAQSNHSHGASAANGSFGFQTLSFSNANGVSFGTSAGSAITASHNGLTTAAASDHSHGNPTLALTNLSGTTASASNGFTLSLSAGAGGGVTPVASASNGSFSFTTLAFSNANNVTFGTSAGSIITASVAAPGAAAENNWFALTGNTTGNTTASGSTIALSGGNNITLSGTNGSVIRIDAPASSSLVGTNGISLSTNGSTVSISNIGVNVSAGTTSNNMTAVTFSNANGVSFGLNGSVVTASAAGGAGPTLSVYEPYEFANNTAFSSHGQNTLYLQRLWPELNYTFNNIEKIASLSFVSSTNSQSVAHTIQYGLYSRDTGTNSTRMTRMGSSAVIFIASFNSNTQAGYTISQSGGGSYTSTSGGTGPLSQFTAGKLFYLPYAGSMQAGMEYAFGFHVSTASAVGTSPARLSFLELTNLNNTTLGRISPSTVQLGSATIYKEWDQVMHRTTQNGLVASYQDSECQVAVSRARQYLIFET